MQFGFLNALGKVMTNGHNHCCHQHKVQLDYLKDELHLASLLNFVMPCKEAFGCKGFSNWVFSKLGFVHMNGLKAHVEVIY
jgi:hypothetical protein